MSKIVFKERFRHQKRFTSVVICVNNSVFHAIVCILFAFKIRVGTGLHRLDVSFLFLSKICLTGLIAIYRPNFWRYLLDLVTSHDTEIFGFNPPPFLVKTAPRVYAHAKRFRIIQNIYQTTCIANINHQKLVFLRKEAKVCTCIRFIKL